MMPDLKLIYQFLDGEYQINQTEADREKKEPLEAHCKQFVTSQGTVFPWDQEHLSSRFLDSLPNYIPFHSNKVIFESSNRDYK